MMLYLQKSFGWRWHCQMPCCMGYAHCPTIPTFQCNCSWSHLVTNLCRRSCLLSKTKNKNSTNKSNKSQSKKRPFFTTLNQGGLYYKRWRFKMIWLTLKPLSRTMETIIISSYFTSSMISLHFSQLSHSTWSVIYGINYDRFSYWASKGFLPFLLNHNEKQIT